MAETFKSDEEYIFKAEFEEDYGLRFMPTGESIVRCRDCKWYVPARNILGGKRPEGRCDYEGVWVIESDYCSKGERGNND